MAGKLRPLDLVIRGIDRVTAPIQRINNRIESMQRPIRRVQRSMSALSKAARLDQLGRSLSRVGAEFAALSRKAALAAGVAGAAASAGFARFVSSGDKLAKTADKLGIGVSTLQALRYAAERSGVATQDFDRGLQTFTQRAAKAAAGTGEASNALRYLGVDLRGANGAIRSTPELLAEISDALARVRNPAVRLQASMALFGEEVGGNMVNLLGRGRASVDALLKDFEDLGGGMSEGAARGAEGMADSFSRLMTFVQGIGSGIGEGLLPAVREIVDQITAWGVANKGMIREGALQFGRDLGDILRQVRDILVAVVPPTLRFIDSIGGVKTVAAGVAAIYGGKLLWSIVGVGKAMWATGIRTVPALLGNLGALGRGALSLGARALPFLTRAFTLLRVAFLGTPLGWFVAGATAVAVVGKLLYDRWEPFRNLCDAIAGKLKEIVSAVRNSSVGRFLGIEEEEPGGGERSPVRSMAKGVGLKGGMRRSAAARSSIGIEDQEEPKAPGVLKRSPQRLLSRKLAPLSMSETSTTPAPVSIVEQAAARVAARENSPAGAASQVLTRELQTETRSPVEAIVRLLLDDRGRLRVGDIRAGRGVDVEVETRLDLGASMAY